MVVFCYKDHLTFGIVLYVICAFALAKFTMSGLVVATFFSVLADADQLQSKVSQWLFNAPTKLFKWGSVVFQLVGSMMIAVSFSGYVGLFKDTCVSGMFLFLVSYIVLEPNDNFIRRRAAESVSLALLFGGLYFGKVIPMCAGSIFLTYTIAGHRSFVSHSFMSLGILCMMVYTIYPVYLLPVIVGYGSHLFGDHVFDVETCPLLFPIDVLMGSYKSKFLRRDLILIAINLLVVGGLSSL